MLGFEDLSPEQLKMVARLSPEVQAWVDELENEKQREIDQIYTLEKHRARTKQIKERLRQGESLHMIIYGEEDDDL